MKHLTKKKRKCFPTFILFWVKIKNCWSWSSTFGPAFFLQWISHPAGKKIQSNSYKGISGEQKMGLSHHIMRFFDWQIWTVGSSMWPKYFRIPKILYFPLWSVATPLVDDGEATKLRRKTDLVVMGKNFYLLFPIMWNFFCHISW